MSIDRPARARAYRSDHRRRQAAETRRRVVEAALDLFGRQGYPATTFVDVAGQAGVSVQTVLKHGPKTALLRAAVELAAFGVEGEADLFDTDLGRSLLEVEDPDTLAVAVGEAMLTINAPTAAVWTAFVGVAHGDPELRSFQLEFLGLVRGQVQRFFEYVDSRGWLRTDVGFEALVESFCVVTSVESYARFVLLDARPPEEYCAFVARTVRATILAPDDVSPGSGGTHRKTRTAEAVPRS
jgi:AcrR family transcriptional regulator